MIKVEIPSKATERREVSPSQGPNAGKTFVFFEQEAWAHLGGKYPQRIVVTHDDPNDAHEPGNYQPEKGSFFVGKFDSLQFRLKLTPLKAAA